ncbi:hypothetical protein Catovirus_1_246 [Catovirus CTV1]|uniref:Uncharacterized protein n=1 Tax=Catovirus CTV1 TaxID=1977631 RepID=A0A1V0S918_9VIRU|nr:hypothetical protein Catovirus_1_246 [Catovirus CTV1]
MFKQSYYSIKYIPKQFQNSEMKDTIINNKVYELYKYINAEDNIKEIYINIFKEDTNNIKFTPEKYQTYEMCADSVTKNIYNLQYCYFITAKLLNQIFAMKKGTSRKTRYDFINNFEEESIIKIIKIRPHFLSRIEKQTHNIIMAAITEDGSVYSYIKNPNPEYERIANIYKRKPKKTMFGNKKKFPCDILFIF